MVCIGNICRSPIAEYLLKSSLSHRAPDVAISSAGLGALVGQPADPISVELMQAQSIDLSMHRARQVTQTLLFETELVLTMTTDQQQQIEQQYPGMSGRVHRLGKWGQFDVPDPFKRPRSIFEQAYALIEQGVHEWQQKLWN